jgi:cellulose synthase/poly-beta-1,6-N-acetylglucosamine synthase-like glycosyltransferase
LPPGWCGKQHACFVLAGLARHPLICFIDADVRLEPDGLARLAAFLEHSGADLVSGVPLQETGTFLERMVIPLIHFILLGFLPLAWMRRSRHPAFAAGCGQLFLARKEAYEQSGGHESIATWLHDGIHLPRAFRACGKKTDLCDSSDLAVCRMYHSASEVWSGFSKNASEGLGSWSMIVPATVVLVGGQVLPFALLACTSVLSPEAVVLTWLAAGLAWLTRLHGVMCFRQSLLGAILHPLGVGVVVAIQWYALLRRLAGQPETWKGRRLLRLVRG